MATIREVASFDIDTDAAVASITKYIKRLKELESERKSTLALGKSTVRVDKEIAQAQKAISNGLKQETQTRKGLNAQIRATTVARKQLSAQTRKNIGLQEKQEKAAKKSEQRSRKSIQGQRRAFSNLKFLAVGAVAGIVSALSEVGQALDSAAALFNPAIALQNNLAEAIKETAGEYVEEKRQLDNRFDSLSNATVGTKEFSAGVKGIVDEYGPYLSDLAKEELALGKVTRAQKEATRALGKRIASQIKGALAQKLVNQIIETQIDQINRTAQANEGASQVIEDIIETPGKVVAKALDPLGLFTEVVDDAAAALPDLSENIVKAQNAGDQLKTKSAIEQLELLKGTSNDLIADFLAQFDGLSELLGGAEEVGKGTEDGVKKTEKAVKDLEGTLAGLDKQLSAAQKTLREDIKFADTDALKAQQEEINDLTASIKQLKILLAGVGQEEIDVTAIPDIIIPDGFSEDIEKKIAAAQLEIKLDNLKVSIERIETRGLIDVTALERARTAALNSFEGTAEARDKLNQELSDKIRARERETTRQVIAAQLEILAIQRRVALSSGQEVNAIDNEIAKLRLNLAKLDGQEVKVNIKVDGVDDLEKQEEKIKQTVLDITEGLGQLSEQVLSFFAEQASASIARLDEQVQKQKSVLDELLGNQSNANATQIQLERDRLDALNKKREQAAQRERTIAIAQIAINAALTIARAAAEGGGVGSAITIAAALLALTFGFVQARQSAQTAAQGFAEGTLSVGLKGNPSGTDTVPAMLTQGEAVIPVDRNKAYSPAVEAIYNRRIPASELNAFVKGYGKSASAISRSLIPRSMLKELDANGITLSMLGSSGVSSNQMQTMIKEMKGIKDTLAGLPVQRINITERGLTKTVSKGLNKKQYLNKRFS